MYYFLPKEFFAKNINKQQTSLHNHIKLKTLINYFGVTLQNHKRKLLSQASK